MLQASLRTADLGWANLTKADLGWANLIEADLSGVNLSRANLHTTTLSGADLIEANLTAANLSEANLRGASLRGANLRSVKMNNETDFREAELQGVKYNTKVMQEENILVGSITIEPTQWPSDFNFERLKAAGAICVDCETP